MLVGGGIKWHCHSSSLTVYKNQHTPSDLAIACLCICLRCIFTQKPVYSLSFSMGVTNTTIGGSVC